MACHWHVSDPFAQMATANGQHVVGYFRFTACGWNSQLKIRRASGQPRWSERLLAELRLEVWIGDAAAIRTQRVRKQKTGRHFP
jgi:hypothetical protein